MKLSVTVKPEHKKFFKEIYGDQKRYEQILLNFISNALKFSNENSNVEIILNVKKVIEPDEQNDNINVSSIGNINFAIICYYSS